MLYLLSQYLDKLNVPGAGVFVYVSFRSLMALVLSLVISMMAGGYFIKYMRRHQHIEQARDAEIDPYGVQKKGVPSMGGIIIIAGILLPSLLLGKLTNVYMVLLLVTVVWFGLLGFIDDKIKLSGNKDGMKPRYKLLGQLLLGCIIGITLWVSPQAVVRENVTREIGHSQVVYHKSEARKSTVTTVPFFKNNNLDYYEAFSWIKDGKTQRACGWILFILITTFVITAVSNGANLNDGMDGMCAGNSAIIGITLGILAYVSGHIHFAGYLNVMYIPGSEEIVVFLCAFVGALIGFLWYNAYPAKVFMGDTGSLAIGGVIAVTAVIIHKELMLPILCGVFLMESLSVMLQLGYARYGNKRGLKLRVFKRAPLHDHYRHKMQPDIKYLIKKPDGLLFESMITTRFWIVTILLAAITVITLKIR
ncbi:MAG: phospho-N-acetylmuramoyl-pentapeptide-transferase [Bacteroides sp.]|nr:phospho-N-acetylmuramoyl-pentapeptide-transferase [Roseburia sp.]MCM1346521.1 phospho-N-acetylmuramoyl-pentapeptide-transferase [Bacteroides sp.]MCM1420101.1 phospho-N-acetylmuramoyl-pentapeptide-transferase [Bacteroides sp.]